MQNKKRGKIKPNLLIEGVQKHLFILLFTFLFLILFVSAVSAARLPTVGGDSDAWGTVLNEYLNVSHNESGELRENTVSSSQIADNSVTDSDISDTTNITTTGTGFFGWLGSLANRITGLFVVDIDASGNINASNYTLNGTTISDWKQAGTDTQKSADNDLLYNDSTTIYFNRTKAGQDLSVNSTTWWASLTGWISGWFYNSANQLAFNETQLNATIDARDDDTTYTAGAGLILTGTQFNITSETCTGTDKLQWNGTNFICSSDIDTDTQKGTSGKYLYNDSINIMLNETELNSTIDSRGVGSSVSTSEIDDGAVTNAKISSDAVNTSQIIDSTITDSDISDTTNLTLGEKITFTLGGIIDNIVNNWIKITGNLNVTGNVTISGTSLKVNNQEVCLADGTNCQPSKDTVWNITGSNYLVNNSGILEVNETKLNNTIDVRASIFNETGLINAVNTSSNIDALGFLNKSGTNANQNINISPYNISASYFTGDGSLLTGITAPGDGTGGWTNTSTTTSTSLDVNVNSGKFFVNSTSGNVGIGTTAPGAKLEVIGKTILGAANSLGGDSLQSVLNVVGTVAGTDASGYPRAMSFYPGLTSNPTNNFAGIEVKPYVDTGVSVTAPFTGIHINEPQKLSGASISGAFGLHISEQQAATNNTALFIKSGTGFASVPSGNFGIYVQSTRDNYIAGNVGIGTTSPQAKLDVNGTIRVETLGAAGATTVCRNANNELSTCSSSERYKENINDYKNGLEIVQKLRPVQFKWKDMEQQDIGFIAEEVEQIEPLLVTYHPDKNISQVEGVKYEQITAILVNAIKEQQAQINALANGQPLPAISVNASVGNQTLGFTTFTDVKVEKDIEVQGHVKFSKDTVGQAVISAGNTEVQINFEQEYETTPIVTLTPNEFIDGQYKLSEKTTTGFKIVLQKPQSQDIVFDWHAFAGNESKEVEVIKNTTKEVVEEEQEDKEPEEETETLQDNITIPEIKGNITEGRIVNETQAGQIINEAIENETAEQETQENIMVTTEIAEESTETSSINESEIISEEDESITNASVNFGGSITGGVIGVRESNNKLFDWFNNILNKIKGLLE